MKREIFSVLFALVLALSLCLVTAVPAGAVEPDPDILNVVPFTLGVGAYEGEPASIAEWSTAAKHTGSSSVHLVTAGSAGNEARIEIDASVVGIETLADIETISWWVSTKLGYSPHIDITLDIDGDGELDPEDMLTAELAVNNTNYTHPPTPGADEWRRTFEMATGDGFAQIDASTIFWVTKMGSGNLNAPSGTLADWQGGVVASDPDGEWPEGVVLGGTAPVVKLEIEVDNWIVESEAYVDDITVNGVVYYGLIQDAIDAASEGDTINVATGTYQEEVKIVDKSLTLLGAQADVPIVDGERAGDESIIRGKGTGSSGTYSWCVIRIQNSGVVINGFTIENGQRDIAMQGISRGISDILVSYNYIKDTGTSGSNSGVFRDSAVANVTIDHNYIASNPNGIKTNGGGTTITDNTFYGNGIGIDFQGGDPYSVHFPDYDQPNYPTIISGNTFTNDSTSIKLRLDRCHQSITITGNDITGARSTAIETWNVYDEGQIVLGIETVLVNPAIHFNNIWNNEFGIVNQVEEINLDAAMNWWGSASGPTHASNTYIVPAGTPQGDAVSDLVDFVPWLNAAHPEGTSFAPVKNITDEPDTLFSSIQAAIDAATTDPGDTVTVSAGTYSEDIEIGIDSLMVKGAQFGVDPTVAGARTDESAESIIDGGCELSFCSNVTFDGFTVTGADNGIRLGPTEACTVSNNIVTDSGYGISVSQSLATLDRNLVKDLLGVEDSPQLAVGIEIWDSSEALISSCIVDGSLDGEVPGYVGIGILVVDGSYADIEDSRIVNWLGTDIWGGTEVHSNGIRIGLDSWYGPSSSSFANINHCLVENNFVGIVVDVDGDASINYNNIQGNEEAGLYRITDDGEGVDAAMNWWGDASGPDGDQGFTEETYTGLLPGTGNGVSANVRCFPWLTRPFETVIEDNIAYFGISTPAGKGWNIVSTPLALDANVTVTVSETESYAANTWGGLLHLGKKAEGDDYALKLHYTMSGDTRVYSPIYYYVSDPDSEEFGWQPADEFTQVNPVDAYYIRMKAADSIPILFSPDFSVPSKKLYHGWNLVGYAYMSFGAASGEEEGSEALETALATVVKVPSEWAGDVTGYAQVVSPPLNQPAWVYIAATDQMIPATEKGLMMIGKGYWVFMENPGTLAGLTFTPISLPRLR